MSNIIKKLDDLFRELIRLRDNWTCQRCGRTRPWKIEVAHYYSRAIKSIRWDMDNSCCLCFECHYKWAHREPKEFGDWWQERLGEKRFNLLLVRKRTKFNKDYGMVELILRELLKKFNRGG